MAESVRGLKAWVLAARPKTLAGAAAPVLVGGALACHQLIHTMNLHLLPAVTNGHAATAFTLCLLLAVFLYLT